MVIDLGYIFILENNTSFLLNIISLRLSYPIQSAFYPSNKLACFGGIEYDMTRESQANDSTAKFSQYVWRLKHSRSFLMGLLLAEDSRNIHTKNICQIQSMSLMELKKKSMMQSTGDQGRSWHSWGIVFYQELSVCLCCYKVEYSVVAVDISIFTMIIHVSSLYTASILIIVTSFFHEPTVQLRMTNDRN